MARNDELWIGQDDKMQGPYTEAVVREWLAAGKLQPDALAWREGMPAWLPLSGMIATAEVRRRPAPPPPSYRPATRADSAYRGASQSDRQTKESTQRRDELPEPPALHWGFLLLFTILSAGIFSHVWAFIQASWIQKIDKRSRASWTLAFAFSFLLPGQFLYFYFRKTRGPGGPHQELVGLGVLLLLVYLVLYLSAYFSMADSLKRKLAAYDLPVKIGGVTLFFFSMHYLQCQLRWAARWKITGQTQPKASKGILWLVFFGLFTIYTVASIADFRKDGARMQVIDGVVLGNRAKIAFSRYYSIHQAMPLDDAAAGLTTASETRGKYVSSVDVAGGKITVAFDTTDSDIAIRDKLLVYTPTFNAGVITWNCNKETTLPAAETPPECR